MNSNGARRILHVLHSPTVGGCESLCVELLGALSRRGWLQEVVFLSDGPGPARDRLKAIGDPSVHVCQYGRGSRWTFVQRFAELCRARRVTAVVAYSFGLHLFVALGARLGGVGRVLACIGNPPPVESRRRRATALLAQLARPFVSREVVCSRYVQRLVARAYGLPERRAVVVHNWCDVEGIAERAAAVRRSRSEPYPVVGMVARLDPIKDHETALRAFARFGARVPEARLRFVGDGPRRGGLERLANALELGDRVEFMGTRLDVPEQIGSFDIFVYATTVGEGFGVVLAEAMAAGVPVVATDIGPCAEVLGEGSAGLLVPPHDPDALAEGIGALWKDPELRARLSAAGLAVARERYSAERAAQEFERLLHG
jgi:glycosyltransferase involved in cell wall biosynthesis